MGVQYLSEDWAAALDEALANHDGFKGAIASANPLGIQFTVTDGSDAGPVNYYLKIADGSSELSLGEIEGADATITSDYETAAGISKGDLNTQTAFMTGKIKVAGNLAVLMMNQNIIQQWGAAGSALDIDYT